MGAILCLQSLHIKSVFKSGANINTLFCHQTAQGHRSVTTPSWVVVGYQDSRNKVKHIMVVRELMKADPIHCNRQELEQRSCPPNKEPNTSRLYVKYNVTVDKINFTPRNATFIPLRIAHFDALFRILSRNTPEETVPQCPRNMPCQTHMGASDECASVMGT